MTHPGAGRSRLSEAYLSSKKKPREGDTGAPSDPGDGDKQEARPVAMEDRASASSVGEPGTGSNAGIKLNIPMVLAVPRGPVLGVVCHTGEAESNHHEEKQRFLHEIFPPIQGRGRAAPGSVPT